MKKIEKDANKYLIRSMTKKSLKEHNSKKRGKLMPRPAVFADKRFRVKHKNASDFEQFGAFFYLN